MVDWLPCGPANLHAGRLGWFFRCRVFLRDGTCTANSVFPIGLIHASWGGTVCEAWTSREALVPLGSLSIRDRPGGRGGFASPAADKLNAVMDQWYQDKDPGTAKKWFEPETRCIHLERSDACPPRGATCGTARL